MAALGIACGDARVCVWAKMRASLWPMAITCAAPSIEMAPVPPSTVHDASEEGGRAHAAQFHVAACGPARREPARGFELVRRHAAMCTWGGGRAQE